MAFLSPFFFSFYINLSLPISLPLAAFLFFFSKKKKFDKIHFLLLFPPPFGM
jgi:hypothetical protein